MSKSNLTRNERSSLIKLLNGDDGCRALLKGRPLEKEKYDWMTSGHEEAIFNRIVKKIFKGMEPDEFLHLLIADEVEFEIKKVTHPFFDMTGRVVPFKGLKGVWAENKRFTLPKAPEKFDYQSILEAYNTYFHREYSWPSHTEFQEEALRQIELIRNNPLIAPALNRYYQPVVIPRIPALKRRINLGGVLDESILPAVGRAYEDAFKYQSRKFYNHKKGELDGQVGIKSNRYHNFLGQVAKKYQIVLFFAHPLQAFSTSASQKQERYLPKEFCLDGALGCAMAIISNAAIMAKNYHTPVYMCAALHPLLLHFSFRADDVKLFFSDTIAIDRPNGSYSGSLLFQG